MRQGHRPIGPQNGTGWPPKRERPSRVRSPHKRHKGAKTADSWANRAYSLRRDID
jgi:hypothetical protein